VSAYLYLCAWTHYTFRSTSLYSFYYFVYRWLPFFIGVNGLAWLLTHAKRSLKRGPGAPAVVAPAGR
jgi:hypothetical protein